MTFHSGPRPALFAAVTVILLTAHATSSTAQSLGDVARRETDRRKQVTPGKVYTDSDVPAGEGSAALQPATPAEPVAQAPAGSTTSEKPARTEPPTSDHPGIEPVIVKAREKRDEQYWRTQARELRSRAAKAESDLAAREARISELDGSPQTPTSIRERATLAARLPRLQQDARALSEELTRFLTRAQMANVPEDWIR
jgi:hypothetical protein